jgi:hypothetical protein
VPTPNAIRAMAAAATRPSILTYFIYLSLVRPRGAGLHYGLRRRHGEGQPLSHEDARESFRPRLLPALGLYPPERFYS